MTWPRGHGRWRADRTARWQRGSPPARPPARAREGVWSPRFREQLRNGQQAEAAALRFAQDARQRLGALTGVRIRIEAAPVVEQQDRAVDESFNRAADDLIDARPISVVDADGPRNRLASLAARRAIEPRVAPSKWRAEDARPCAGNVLHQIGGPSNRHAHRAGCP